MRIIKEIIFPDHYEYKKQDIEKIKFLANETNSKIITTEKDYVKIKELALTDKQLKTIKKWMEEKIQETFVNVNSDSSYCDFAYNWMKE